MRSCWNEKPEERPSFSELRKVMKEMGSKREVQNQIRPTDCLRYSLHMHDVNPACIKLLFLNRLIVFAIYDIYFVSLFNISCIICSSTPFILLSIKVYMT